MRHLEQIFSIKGKTAFITGAGSGLGQHTAILFAKLGAQVVITDVNEQGLQETATAIEAASGQVLSLVMDVRRQESVKTCVAQAVEHFDHIDIVLNCAAVIYYEPFLATSQENWDQNYEVDLRGSWFVCREIAEHMMQRNIKGSMINLASSLCHRTQKDLTPYNAIKAGVAHMSRSMALELMEHGIRVNAVAPGFIATNMVKAFLETDDGKKAVTSVPMKRAADLSELEGLMVFLASNASSYMSGSLLMIDGGLAYNEILIP